MKQTDKECVSNTIKIIGSKWTTLLLRELCEGTKRFGELERALDGISPRTLSARLQQLEIKGIITKKVFAQVPLRVEYSLTSKGKSLKNIIETMHQWGRQYPSQG